MTEQEHIDGVKQAQDEHKSWILDNQKIHLGMVTSQVDRMSEALEDQTNLSLIHEKDRIERDKGKDQSNAWLCFIEQGARLGSCDFMDLARFADGLLIEYNKRFNV